MFLGGHGGGASAVQAQRPGKEGGQKTTPQWPSATFDCDDTASQRKVTHMLLLPPPSSFLQSASSRLRVQPSTGPPWRYPIPSHPHFWLSVPGLVESSRLHSTCVRVECAWKEPSVGLTGCRECANTLLLDPSSFMPNVFALLIASLDFLLVVLETLSHSRD